MTTHPDPAGTRLAELLQAWRSDIVEVPIPSLVDPAHAVDVVIKAMRRSRVHAPPDGACTRPRDPVRRDAQKDIL
jgi:hypothetical protein